jgi:hypothetical protein
MDIAVMRKQLVEAKAELARVEREHESLEALVKGLEGWLSLHGGEEARPLKLGLATSPRRPPASLPKGEISIRAAVLQAIRQAGPAGLTSEDLIPEVRKLGAITVAKDPKRIVESMAYRWRSEGQPLERANQRWFWKGSD